MQFNSFAYLFAFLPLSVFVYYLLQSTPWRNAALVLFSLFFYGWGEPRFIILLVGSSIVDYHLGQAIFKSEVKSTRLCYLILSLVFNLGILFFFKRWDAFLSAANPHDTTFLLNSQIPPGISFYTFQTLSYTIDIYRRKFSPKGSFIDYLTFISFFPHLIAGPIVRARNLLPQIIHKHNRLKPQHLETALFFIGWGIFKKVVLADNFGHLVDRAKENITVPGTGIILALSFTMQIYCDFSAYSDIARGSARLFGIRLQRNFLTPYFALNPSDFWRRWHITLSRFVRDYVYIPLGGSQREPQRNKFNVYLTWILMGLWHGVGAFYILWGMYHAMLIITYRQFPIDYFLVKKLGTRIGKYVAIFLMFFFTAFGWVIFWSKNFYELFGIILSGLSVFASPLHLPPVFSALFYGWAFYALPLILSEWLSYTRHKEFTELHPVMPLYLRVPLYLFMLYAVIFFGSRGTYNFIYFKF